MTPSRQLDRLVARIGAFRPGEPLDQVSITLCEDNRTVMAELWRGEDMAAVVVSTLPAAIDPETFDFETEAMWSAWVRELRAAAELAIRA